MLVQVLSDCHIECYKSYPMLIQTADILILAGDIGHIDKPSYTDFINYVSSIWKRVIITLGNHEFYSNHDSYNSLMERYITLFEKYDNVELLEKNESKIEGYRVLGLVFWSEHKNPTLMNCPKKITGSFAQDGKRIKIGVDAINELHSKSVEWLVNTYDPDIPTIIVTHYPLTRDSQYTRQERFNNESDIKLYEFTNELPVKPRSKLICISGHTHFSHDFVDEYGVRYISNQYGYPFELKNGITNCNNNLMFDIGEPVII